MSHVSISLEILEQLTDLTGLSALTGEALVTRLREVFNFLPADTDFTLDNSGMVHVKAPPPPSSDQKNAERQAQKAARAASNGDYSKARKLFNKALDLDPTLTNARRDLAMLCSEIGDHEAAKDYLIDVLRTTPDDAWAYVILANHYAKAEDNQVMALTLLNRAIDISPQDPYAHNSLAGVYLEQGKHDLALQHFDLALNSLPTLANALYGRAIIHIQEQDFSAAEAAFESLFHNADLSDPRNKEMLNDARSTFIKVENILANNRQNESAKAVNVLRAQVEEISGYPVIEIEGQLPSHIAATIRMAWKHNRDHHQLLLRGHDYPEILRQHLTAHELYHLLFESRARSRDVNKWFTADDTNRRTARAEITDSQNYLRNEGISANNLDGLFAHFFSGVTSFL